MFNDMKRREFLKGSAMGVSALAASPWDVILSEAKDLHLFIIKATVQTLRCALHDG